MQISMTELELYKSLGERIAETDTNRVVRIHCLVAIRAALFFLTFATVFHIITPSPSASPAPLS